MATQVEAAIDPPGEQSEGDPYLQEVEIAEDEAMNQMEGLLPECVAEDSKSANVERGDVEVGGKAESAGTGEVVACRRSRGSCRPPVPCPHVSVAPPNPTIYRLGTRCDRGKQQQ